MKKYLFVFLIVVITITAVGVNADVYLKEKTHTDSIYHHGTVEPATETVSEFWIGNKKMAAFTEGRIVIIDLNQNQFIFANRNDKTYVETTLPLDLAKILPEQLMMRIALFRTKGEVKETSETKKIGKWDTRCYEINTWIVYEGARLNQRDTKAWYTTNVPFDLNVYMEILPVFLTLSNFDETLVNEMKKIKGVRVSSETLRYIDGKSVKSKSEIVEMSEKNAPAGIYSTPKEFKKKDQLTIQDLRTQ
jgi:hypothetical protein